MNGYRAHKTILQTGDIVPPSTSFFDAIREDKKAVEKLLESVRPLHLPQRKNVVFVFEDEKEGRKWASRERRNLYKVELEANSILHKADWCWLSIIMTALGRNDPQATSYAKEYWAGKATGHPVWELLTTSATVVEEIKIPELERNRLLCEAYGLPNLRN